MSLTRELTVQIKDEARKIQKLGQKFLHNYLFLAVGVVGGACADVEQTFVQVSQFEKREKLLEMLTAGKTLVFVENKKTADFIASYLCQTEHAATCIHGDRLQPERERALKDFKIDQKPSLWPPGDLTLGRLPIIVCLKSKIFSVAVLLM